MIQLHGQSLTFLAGVQGGFPNGNFKSISGTGWGMIGQFNYRLSDRFSAIGSLDGISFAQKDQRFVYPVAADIRFKVGIESVQIGGKFKLTKTENKSLFISGEAGIIGFRLNVTNNQNGAKQTTEDYNFCYRVMIGYTLDRWEIRWAQQFATNQAQSLNFSSLQAGYYLHFKPRKKVSLN